MLPLIEAETVLFAAVVSTLILPMVCLLTAEAASEPEEFEILLLAILIILELAVSD